MSIPDPCSQGLEIVLEERTGSCESQKGMEDQRETIFWTWQDTTPMNS